MAISTEIVGKAFGPFVRDYTFKDLEICALGCGAGWDGHVDLDYVNEGDAKNPELKVPPIFAVPLTVNEEMTTTLDYGFDYSGSLHYGIDVHFHAPFKMADHIETYVTQEAIWDRGEGRGSLSKQVGKSYSSDGTHLCTVDTYDCCIYDGGWGGEQPPKDVVEYPDREPDFVYEETYGLNWPLVYRLMGDWHQQHINWSYTEQTGLERPIAHGVSSAGVAMRHAISLLFPGHPEAMTRFKCRFTLPVLPGVRLCTEVWKTAEGEARFRMVNADAPDSKLVLEQLHRGVGSLARIANSFPKRSAENRRTFFLAPHICIATPFFFLRTPPRFVALLREICSATVAGGRVVFAGSLLPSLGLVRVSRVLPCRRCQDSALSQSLPC